MCASCISCTATGDFIDRLVIYILFVLDYKSILCIVACKMMIL